MTTINRTKLLEYLDHVMDEELKLSRLMHCCLSDSILERETDTRLALAYRFKEFEAEKAKARQGTRNDLVGKDSNISSPVNTSDDSTKGRALGVIAKKAGVSHTQIQKSRTVGFWE